MSKEDRGQELTDGEKNSARANAIADAKKKATAEGTKDQEMVIDLSKESKEAALEKTSQSGNSKAN